ncbi:MAG: hypothetical protein ACPGO5_03070 [Patescibacteria group bacterium]
MKNIPVGAEVITTLKSSAQVVISRMRDYLQKDQVVTVQRGDESFKVKVIKVRKTRGQKTNYTLQKV